MTTKLFLSGSQMSCIRRAIEISESYLPKDRCLEITRKARNHYFNECLAYAEVFLKRENFAGAFRLVKEALMFNQSTDAIKQLFSWLARDETAPLHKIIISQLMAPNEGFRG